MLYAKPVVTVSILPQQYMVEKIAGDTVDVLVMVAASANHETYEPKPSQMKLLAKSDIYFTIGLPFERAWLDRFTAASPKLSVTDVGKGIEKIGLEDHHHDAHEHEHNVHAYHDDDHEYSSHADHDDEHDAHDGHEHSAHASHDAHDKHADYDSEHEHSTHAEHDDDEHNAHASHEHGTHADHDAHELDPHIWLDPALVKIQSKTIADTLSLKYPQNAALYAKNYESFSKELDALDAKLSKKLTALKNRSFFVFHPSWGYFAKRYGLEQIYVEVEGREPKAAELIEILKKAKEKNIKALLVEPQVSEKNAKIVAKEIGAKLIKVDPVKKDVSKNLDEVADMLLGI
jgi:zinc transport system substrate-binding protein